MKRRTFSRFLLIGASLSANVLYGAAPQRTILPPSPRTNAEFGSAVANLGAHVIIGAPDDSIGFGGSGAAYVFDRSSGSLLTTIRNPTSATKNFGVSVSIFQNQYLISRLADPSGHKGMAYLINQNGDIVRSFSSPSNSFSDAFGIRATSIGNIVAVAAITDDSQAMNSGVVHLYDGTSGQFLRTINNPHPKAEDRFGLSFTVLGSNLVIGSTGGATGTGAAYLFDPTTGSLIREFDNPTPAVGDDFGRAVATLGGELLVGAPGDDTSGMNVGSVYRLNPLTGDLIDTLADPSPNGQDGFGSTIGVTPSGIGIGAPFRSLSQANSGFEVGGVFLYDSQLAYRSLITPPTPARQDRFGMAISGAGGDLVLGYQLDDFQGFQDSGSVLVYRVPEPPVASLLLCVSSVLRLRRRFRSI